MGMSDHSLTIALLKTLLNTSMVLLAAESSTRASTSCLQVVDLLMKNLKSTGISLSHLVYRRHNQLHLRDVMLRARAGQYGTNKLPSTCNSLLSTSVTTMLMPGRSQRHKNKRT